MAGKIIHGGTNHPLYTTWNRMRQRCNNPNIPQYRDWGGRGIKIAQEWDDFWRFVADMGEKPNGCSLDRIDNDKGYSKENCKWSTRKEQNRNKRIYKNSTVFTHNGETLCINKWAERMGLTVQAIWWRLERGWSIGDAVLTPKGNTGPKVRH